MLHGTMPSNNERSDETGRGDRDRDMRLQLGAENEEIASFLQHGPQWPECLPAQGMPLPEAPHAMLPICYAHMFTATCLPLTMPHATCHATCLPCLVRSSCQGTRLLLLLLLPMSPGRDIEALSYALPAQTVRRASSCLTCSWHACHACLPAQVTDRDELEACPCLPFR